eukprot:scaffold426_cov219-Amphora_coffeaeformis.AAC.31
MKGAMRKILHSRRVFESPIHQEAPHPRPTKVDCTHRLRWTAHTQQWLPALVAGLPLACFRFDHELPTRIWWRRFAWHCCRQLSFPSSNTQLCMSLVLVVSLWRMCTKRGREEATPLGRGDLRAGGL